MQNNIIKHDKIIFDYEINKITELSKQSNVVFTNGCFDILHSAHIKLFQYSKSQGNILVVGLNSDESIKHLKGPERPINNIEERSTILSLFHFIDYIIIFDEDTPYNILKLLQPDVIVKGGDYCVETIIGTEYCKEVKLFNYIQNKSTSLVVSKIKKNPV
jgi:D-beta-D-heptose 7-phosphate kinase/D-beta-D-heptose 1-phosphate adenosyltransferase